MNHWFQQVEKYALALDPYAFLLVFIVMLIVLLNELLHKRAVSVMFGLMGLTKMVAIRRSEKPFLYWFVIAVDFVWATLVGLVGLSFFGN